MGPLSLLATHIGVGFHAGLDSVNSSGMLERSVLSSSFCSVSLYFYLCIHKDIHEDIETKIWIISVHQIYRQNVSSAFLILTHS